MSTGILAYDLDLIFEGQGSGQAVIERDASVPDAYGGDTRPNWQTHATVPCVHVWNRATGARSTNRTYVSPARKVSESEGFLLVPPGSDATEEDRVAKIIDQQGNTVIDGLFTITAVLNQGTHTELYVTRAHLGE